jgi:hypothetical protein
MEITSTKKKIGTGSLSLIFSVLAFIIGWPSISGVTHHYIITLLRLQDLFNASALDMFLGILVVAFYGISWYLCRKFNDDWGVSISKRVNIFAVTYLFFTIIRILGL